jgi:hypothetical protein
VPQWPPRLRLCAPRVGRTRGFSTFDPSSRRRPSVGNYPQDMARTARQSVRNTRSKDVGVPQWAAAVDGNRTPEDRVNFSPDWREPCTMSCVSPPTLNEALTLWSSH